MFYDIFALTTRGLERITEAEMRTVPGVAIKRTEYRRVRAECDDIGEIPVLRTADDVFLEIDTWHGIKHTRAMLPQFTQRSADLDLLSNAYLLEAVRPIGENPTFAVTASFVGKRNYNYHEIKEHIAAGIIQSYPMWQYVEDDSDATLNLRLFIEQDNALIGLRLARDPLHRRPYKQETLAGSTKPPVAAAMLRLANLKSNHHVLDPFCGSGTIPIEAVKMGYIGAGSDSNPEAVVVSKRNANDAEENISFTVEDARQLSHEDDSFDGLVSNLPWGRQITVDDDLRAVYHLSYKEMRRVVKKGGKIVLLTTLPDLIPDDPVDKYEISLYGQQPMIVVYKVR